MKRMHYRYGNVQRVSRPRGPDVWVYRYREGGVRRAVNLGTTEQYSTEALAIRAAEALRPMRIRRIGAHEPSALERWWIAT